MILTDCTGILKAQMEWQRDGETERERAREREVQTMDRKAENGSSLCCLAVVYDLEVV